MISSEITSDLRSLIIRCSIIFCEKNFDYISTILSVILQKMKFISSPGVIHPWNGYNIFKCLTKTSRNNSVEVSSFVSFELKETLNSTDKLEKAVKYPASVFRPHTFEGIKNLRVLIICRNLLKTFNSAKFEFFVGFFSCR